MFDYTFDQYLREKPTHVAPGAHFSYLQITDTYPHKMQFVNLLRYARLILEGSSPDNNVDVILELRKCTEDHSWDAVVEALEWAPVRCASLTLVIPYTLNQAEARVIEDRQMLRAYGVTLLGKT